MQKVVADLNLACLYSVRGDISNALLHLRKFDEIAFVPYWDVIEFKCNPMLDNIRETKTFKDVLIHAEKKYQEMHDNINKFLMKERISMN